MKKLIFFLFFLLIIPLGFSQGVWYVVEYDEMSLLDISNDNDGGFSLFSLENSREKQEEKLSELDLIVSNLNKDEKELSFDVMSFSSSEDEIYPLRYLKAGVMIKIEDESVLDEILSLDFVKGVELAPVFYPLISSSRELLDISLIWDMIDLSDTNLRGSGVTIAVLDSGLAVSHPDFGCDSFAECERIVDYRNFISGEDSQNPFDSGGHGTHVTSILSSNNPDDNFKGIAPEANLAIYKVCNFTTCPSVYQGLERVLAINNDESNGVHIDIISLSLGGAGNPNDSFSQYVQTLIDSGIIVVAAAGNSGPSGDDNCRLDLSSGYFSICSPANARGVIAVGASSKNEPEFLAGFSSRGPTSIGTIRPDIIAPGVNICAGKHSGSGSCSSSSEHILKSGTSMATPIVSGIIALFKQKNPEWSASQIQSALRATSSDIGYSILEQGWGRVDPISLFSLQEVPCEVRFDSSDYSFGHEQSTLLNINANISCPDFESYSLEVGRIYDLSKNPDLWTEVLGGEVEGEVSLSIPMQISSGPSILRLRAFDANSTYNNVDYLYIELGEEIEFFDIEFEVDGFDMRFIEGDDELISGREYDFNIEILGDEDLSEVEFNLRDYKFIEEGSVLVLNTYNGEFIELSLDEVEGGYARFRTNLSEEEFYLREGRIAQINSTHHIFLEEVLANSISIRFLELLSEENLIGEFEQGVSNLNFEKLLEESGIYNFLLRPRYQDKYSIKAGILEINSLNLLELPVRMHIADFENNSEINLSVSSMFFNISFSKNISEFNLSKNGGEFESLIDLVLNNSFEENISIDFGENVFEFALRDEDENLVNYTFEFYARDISIPIMNVTSPILNEINNLSSLGFRLVSNFSKSIEEIYFEYDGFEYEIEMINSTHINTTIPLKKYGDVSMVFYFLDNYGIEGEFELNFTARLWLGGVEGDFDGDGIPDELDSVIGGSENVFTNFGEILVEIDGLDNLSQIFNESSDITFRRDGNLLISSSMNLSEELLNLTRIRILDRVNEGRVGLLVSGLEVQNGKTIYLYTQNNSEALRSLCIKDARISTFSNISDDCSGEDEFYVHQTPYSEGNYNVTYDSLGNFFRISGLTHSAVFQTCTENWVVGEWSACSSGSQIRTVSDLNSCGSEFSRPEQTRSCVVEDDSGNGDGSGGGGGGGGGGGPTPPPANNTLTRPGSGITNSFDILIDSQSNSANIFSGNRDVGFRLKSSNTTLIEIRHDFSSAPLDLTGITIAFDRNHQRGSYILTYGIPETITRKNMRLPKRINSSTVCIRDRETTHINNISVDCSGQGERILSCNGLSSSGYRCYDEGDYYFVTGLSHSGILEIEKIEEEIVEEVSQNNNSESSQSQVSSSSSQTSARTEQRSSDETYEMDAELELDLEAQLLQGNESLEEVEEEVFEGSIISLILFLFVGGVMTALATIFYLKTHKSRVVKKDDNKVHLKNSEEFEIEEHIRKYIKENRDKFSRVELYEALEKTHANTNTINRILDMELKKKKK